MSAGPPGKQQRRYTSILVRHIATVHLVAKSNLKLKNGTRFDDMPMPNLENHGDEEPSDESEPE